MPHSELNPAFMHRCLDLASQGRGRVGNGVLVGAVLVREGKIISERFHAAYGDAHAERALLEGYEGQIHPEDLLYVNLEPCVHHGKTPPCTDIIIQRSVKTVVYGMQDPDPRVRGKGLEELQRADVTVIGPFERGLCERMNKGFIQVRRYQRPYITLKQAITSDGKIASANGSPMKITSTKQDVWAHTFLRARHDAILVGVGTIISDNPQLNRRFDQNVIFAHLEGLNETICNDVISDQPYRIILDPMLNIPQDAHVVSDAIADRTMLCVTPDAALGNAGKCADLQERGVRICRIPLEAGHFDWKLLWESMLTPQKGYAGITSILVEGGVQTWEAFRASGFVDEEVTLTG